MNKERIAIVDSNRCKPKKCNLECKKNCPVVSMGKLCIEVSKISPITTISESLCTGCGICVKKCPFDAIKIINDLPLNLKKDLIHRYNINSFKLHRLPIPKFNQILGLIGSNGLGKSTTLKILSGSLIPNMGDFTKKSNLENVLNSVKGTELHGYFLRLFKDNPKTIIKPQYVDVIPNALKGNVGKILNAKNEQNNLSYLVQELDLEKILNRNVDELSGGELQRFAIAITCLQKADIYMFDEPTSYLDIKQRLKVSNVIKSLLSNDKVVIVVEHDLSILDYLADYICCLYGKPGIYGVSTSSYGSKEGINMFLDGFIPDENLRFRKYSLDFKITDNAVKTFEKKINFYNYPKITKKINNFSLNIESGSFSESEIIVLLGENGTGKTTFIRLLAGILKSDNLDSNPLYLSVSYKPQKINPKFQGTVKDLFYTKLQDLWQHPQFLSDVIKPMKINDILNQNVQTLSGGELQRVAITLCLGTPADIYLLDEPSAYLDSEQRIITSKVIKRFILNSKKSAFIVEHDFIMATYLADKVILFEGTPTVDIVAKTPQSLLTGMNSFLKTLNVTFRRDPTNYRPRINKLNSIKDREQKENGNYFHNE